MHCRSAREWTRSRREGPQDAAGDRPWRSHLAVCAACAADARDQEQLAAWTRDLPLATPSEGFDWRLRLAMARAERDGLPPLEDAPPVRFGDRFQFWAAAAAAAVVVVAAGWLVLRPQSTASRVGGGAVAQHTPAPDADGLVVPVRDGPGVATYGPPQPLPYFYFIQPAPAVPPDTTPAASAPAR
jgi:hypothetical protein